MKFSNEKQILSNTGSKIIGLKIYIYEKKSFHNKRVQLGANTHLGAKNHVK